MDLVYDVDLVAGLVRGVINPVAEASDVINTTITGSINLNHIQSPTLGDCLAYRASVTRFTLAIAKAVHCLSQDAPGAGLTCPSWTIKKIGVRYTTTIEGVA